MLCLLAMLALGTSLSALAAPLPVTAKLSWTAPTTYDDTAKTPLPASDLGPYKLYWGHSLTTMTNVITIPATATTYDWSATIDVTVNTVKPVYWAITASSVSSGKESARSAAVKKDFSLSVDAAPATPAALSVGASSCTAPAGYTCAVLP